MTQSKINFPIFLYNDNRVCICTRDPQSFLLHWVAPIIQFVFVNLYVKIYHDRVAKTRASIQHLTQKYPKSVNSLYFSFNCRLYPDEDCLPINKSPLNDRQALYSSIAYIPISDLKDLT